ncbi:MAG: hypothetical protein WBB23_06310 [Desulforhopalus sp.]
MRIILTGLLREFGARFIDGCMWASHIQLDGKLVTGQNPVSSAKAAEAAIRLLEQK